MKTLNLVCMLVLTVLSISCSRQEDTQATTVGTGVVTAQINGRLFTSEQAGAAYDKVTETLTLVGYNENHLTGFTLQRFTGAGIIPLVDVGSVGSTGSYIDARTHINYTIRDGRTGTVTVRKFDGINLEGSFSMKTYDSQQKREVIVTNGTFKVPVETL